MSDIYDVPYEDIINFLEDNGQKIPKNKDKAYEVAEILIRDKKSKNYPTSMIEWMLAYNSMDKNITMYTLYDINNMNESQIDELANELEMKNNNKDNIINILRYMNKILDYELFELEKLFIGFNYYDDDVLVTNREIKKLTNLKELDLMYNSVIGDDGIKNLTNLRSLSIMENYRITDDGIKNLTNLRELNLDFFSKITDKVLKSLTHLQKLSLSGNNMITDNGIKDLINLTYLSLIRNNKITDNGVKNLTNLTKLFITNNNNITSNGIKNLTNLRKLYLSYANPINNETLENHPNIKIIIQ